MENETTSNVTQGDVVYGSNEPNEEVKGEQENQPEKEQGSESQNENEGQPEEQKKDSKEVSEEAKNENESEEEGGEDDASKESDKKEKIEYDLKLSEDSYLDESIAEDIKSFAEKHGLSNEAANEMLKSQESIANNFASQLKEKHEEQVDNWFKESQRDPEIGGEKLKETAELSKRALDAFGSKDLANALRETGYGNNPEVVKFLSRIGKLVSNDTLVNSGAEGRQTSRAEILYGKE